MHLVDVGPFPDHVAVPDDDQLLHPVGARVLLQVADGRRQLLRIDTLGLRRPLFPLGSRKRHLFAGRSAGLFSSPLESDFDHASPETMQVEKMELLATLLYRLHKKGN